MSKFIGLVAMSMMLSGLASAGHHKHPLVNIEKADKVFIRGGMSHHHKVKMLKCLLMVKKHKSADDAMEAKSAEITEHCGKHKLSDEKCEKMRHRVSKRVHACFAVHNFLDSFFDRDRSEAKASKQ